MEIKECNIYELEGLSYGTPFGIQHKIHKIKIGENNEYTKITVL